MVLQTKSRQTMAAVTGVRNWASTHYDVDKEIVVSEQRTSTEDSIWPWVRKNWNDRRWPDFIRDFYHRQDWGNGFITEKGEIYSNLDEVHLSGAYAGNWTVDHTGPVLLAGFSTPFSLANSTDLSNENAVMFALGGTAIARTRPGKPEVDLATAIGELRFGGIPTIIGSLFERSRTLKDLFREGGNEYLNLQFGWAPLIRDLEGLFKAISESHKLLKAHEKQLDKLLTRGYTFDSTIDTVEALTKASSMANYELAPATALSSTLLSLRPSVVPPIETTRTVTKSYFRGGYRFYYPDLDTAFRQLQEYEAKANLLLGTRLDPEVLWNLQPWTWLADWFLNFGDVLGNLSALASDGLVIQYAYLMREVRISKEIYFPRGIYSRRNGASMVPTDIPLSVHLNYHRKMRVRASPFGFGLTPEMFTPQQWAILAALGISRGLK